MSGSRQPQAVIGPGVADPYFGMDPAKHPCMRQYESMPLCYDKACLEACQRPNPRYGAQAAPAALPPAPQPKETTMGAPDLELDPPPSTDAKKGARGRKSADGQEQPLKLDVIKKRMPELLKLSTEKEAATEAFSDAVKAVAEKSGFNANAIKKFVAARQAQDGFADKHRDAEQLVLLFETIGE